MPDYAADMPEGDSLHRAANSLQVLAGQRVAVETPHPRAAGKQLAERLDGRLLESVEAVGKNLLLHFEGGLVLRSHLRMTGRWRVEPRGARRTGRPWLVLRGEEHEAVRARLGHLLADAGGGVRGVAVLACAPGEQHELGLMMTAIGLRRDGWKVVYLGADTPLEDALDLARLVSARLLGLSVAMAERAASLETALRTAEQPEGLSVVLGGAGASRVLARRLGALHAGPELDGAVAALRVVAA